MPLSTKTTSNLAPEIAQEQSIEGHLHRLWTEQSRRLALSGACWVFGALGMLIAVDFLLDWSLDLPGYCRLLLLAVNLIVLAWVAWRKLRLRRFNIVDQALVVERTVPKLDGLLISSIQLDQPQSENRGVSSQLISAIKRLARQAAQSLDWSKASPRILIGSSLSFAAIALVFVSAIAIWDIRFLKVLTVRMFNPVSTLAYPTDTIIEMTEGDKVVRAGKPVTLSAQTHGKVPETGHLYVRFEGLDWETILLTGSEGAFEHTLSRMTDDLQYYFRLGDARSSQYQVTVVRPPLIVDGRVMLQYPDYTNMSDQEVHTLNVKAPEGTRLQWRLSLNKPVTAAEMRLEGGDTKTMTISNDGHEIKMDLTVTASQPYVIAMHWSLEDKTYIDEGPKHYIQIVPDADPQVGLLSPTEDTKATLRKTIPISYGARDDYGLTDSVIVYSVNDGGEMQQELPAITGKREIEETYDWPITQLLPALKLGDIVTFAVEVTDGRPGSPGKTRSISRRVQFVSDSEYVAYILSRQRKYLGRLRPLYKQQREAVKQLDEVIVKPSKDME